MVDYTDVINEISSLLFKAITEARTRFTIKSSSTRPRNLQAVAISRLAGSVDAFGLVKQSGDAVSQGNGPNCTSPLADKIFVIVWSD